MLQLFNNQVGLDAASLGFPSVDSCNAIVYQTSQGLCGLHNYGGDSPFQYEARADAFTAFVQECNIQHTTQSRNLYSVINKRYNPRVQEIRKMWVDEMTAFAKSLKFTGTVHLIALIKHLDGGPVYIQYDLNAKSDGCDVRYKKFSKMQAAMVEKAPDGLGELKKDMKTWNESMGQVLRYTRAAPTEIVGSVAMKQSTSTLKLATGDDTNDNSYRFSFSCG